MAADVAAVTSVYESTGLGAGGTTDCPVPAGGTTDDAYIVVTMAQLTGGTPATPTSPGFAELTGSPADDTNFFGYTIHAIRRDHDGTEGANFTITSPDAVSELMVVCMLVTEAGDLDQNVSVGNPTSDITTLQQTTTEANCLAIVCAAGTFGDIAAPDPATYSPITGSPFADSAFGVYSHLQVAAGATPADTITFSAGTSVATMTFCIRTEASTPTAPGDPTSINAAAGDGQGTLTWVDETTGVPPGTYDVEVSPAPHSSWTAVDTDLAAGTQTSTATGLTNGTVYRFRIRAQNATGDNPSGWIESGDFTPAAAAAGAAGSFALVSGSGQGIPSTSLAALDMGAIDTDADSILSESSGVFTPQQPGYYLVVGEAKFTTTHNNRANLELQLRRNSAAVAGAWGSGYARNTGNPHIWMRASLIAHFNGSTDTFDFQHRQDTGSGAPAGSYAWTRVKVVRLSAGGTDSLPFAHYGTPTLTAGSGTTPTAVTGFDVITETDTSVIELQAGGTDIELKEADRPYLISYGLKNNTSIGPRTGRIGDLALDGTVVAHSYSQAYQRDASNQYATPEALGLVRPAAANQNLNVRLRGHTGESWGTFDQGGWQLSDAAGEAGIMVIALPPETATAIYEDTVAGQTFSSATTLAMDTIASPVGTPAAPFSRVDDTDIDITADADVLAYAGVFTRRETSSGTRQSNAVRWELNSTDLTADTELGDYVRGDQGTQDHYNGAYFALLVRSLAANDRLQLEKFDPGTDDGNNDITAAAGSFFIDLGTLAAAEQRVELGVVVDVTTPQPLTGAKSLELGVATELEQPQPLTGAKSLELGTVVEVEVPQPLAAGKRVELGVVVDVTTPQPLTGAKSLELGVATELEQPQAVGAGVARQLGVAIDLEVPQPLAASKSLELGVVVDVATPQPLTGAKSLELGVVTELEQPQPLTGAKSLELGTVVEVEVPQPITRQGAQNVELGVVTELEVPQPLTGAKSLELGTVVEVEVPQPLAAGKSLELGVVVDVATPQPLTGAKSLQLGTVVEVEVPQPLTPIGEQRVELGVVADVTTPQPLTGAKSLQLGTVLEVEVPQPITRQGAQNVELGAVTELEVPQPLAAGKSLELGVVVDVATPQPLTGAKSLELGTVVEVEVPQPLAPLGEQRVELGTVVEAEVPQPLAAGKRLELGVVVDDTAPQPLQVSRSLELGTVVDDTTPQPLTGAKSLELGVVIGVDVPVALFLQVGIELVMRVRGVRDPLRVMGVSKGDSSRTVDGGPTPINISR